MIQIVESNLKQLKIQRKNLLIMFQFLYRCELWYDKTNLVTRDKISNIQISMAKIKYFAFV